MGELTKMRRAKKIGEILKSLREDAGETQAQVAEATNVSAMAISLYESGDRIPRDETKMLLSKHFNVPVTIFYTL